MALSEELPIYKDSFDLLEQLTELSKDLPKFLRCTLGTRMVDLSLDMLGQIYRANMAMEGRQAVITDMLISYRQLLMLLRVCYHQKALSTGKYAELMKMLDSVGRQGTAWKNKTSEFPSTQGV